MIHVSISEQHPGRAALRSTRSGTSTIDALVAFTLLATTIAVATPLFVRQGRLLKSQRDYRLALEELSNQLDRLTALPADELPAALERLAPSDFLSERVPGGRLIGELSPAQFGSRLVLKISWDDPRAARPPVSLAAWIPPPTQSTVAPPEEEP